MTDKYIRKSEGQMGAACAFDMVREQLGSDYRGTSSLLDSVQPDDDKEILDTPLLKLCMEYGLIYAFEPRTDVDDPRVKDVAMKLSTKFKDEVLEPAAKLVADFIIKYKGVSLVKEKQTATCTPYEVYLTKGALDQLLEGLRK